MPYSDDLRRKLIAAWEAEHLSQRELSGLFGVSLGWVEKVLRRWRETGQAEAVRFRRGPLPSVKLIRLQRLAQQDPDATLAELGHRLKVSAPTICRGLQQLGLPRKKRHSMPASATRLGCSGDVRTGGRRAVVWTRST